MATVRKRKWIHSGVENEAWIVAYTDQGGKRRVKTFNTKKAADAFRIATESEIVEGRHVSGLVAKSIKFVAEHYLNNSAQRRRDGRIGYNRERNIRYSVQNHIVPCLGARTLMDLQSADFETLHRWVLDRGHRPIRTVVLIRELAAMEAYAVTRKWAKGGLAQAGLKTFRGIKAAPMAVPTKEQVRLLLAAASLPKSKYDYPRMRVLVSCFVHLAAICGLRFGEICALRREDVDLDAGQIRVAHNMTYDDVLKSPKTAAGHRVVYTPPMLVALIREWLDKYLLTERRGLIFRYGNGGMVSPGTFFVRWVNLQLRAGVADPAGAHFKFHALRHFAASHMVDIGIPITDVAQLMGHSKFDTTLQIYAHPLRGIEYRRGAFESMAGALSDTVDATRALQHIISP